VKERGEAEKEKRPLWDFGSGGEGKEKAFLNNQGSQINETTLQK